LPVKPTYPGVYIEEVPSGVHTITGVATSIAAFVDFFGRGPMNRAVQLFSMADFEREFGGLDSRSEASYGIQQFFLNGGSETWAVRVASTLETTLSADVNASAVVIEVADTSAFPAAGAITIESEVVLYTGKDATHFTGCTRGAQGTTGASHTSPTAVSQPPATAAVVALDGVSGGADALRITALSAGRWGNDLRASVDYATSDPSTLFNLVISEVGISNGRTIVARQEIFRDLSMASANPRFVETIVNSGSALVTVDALGPNRPAASGTVGGAISGFPIATPAAGSRISIAFSPNADGSSSDSRDVDLGATPFSSLDAAAARLEAAIRNARPNEPAWAQADVRVVADALQVIAGPSAPGGNFTFSNVSASENSAALLKLRVGDGATVNVAAYQLGAPLSGAGQGDAIVGLDGGPPNATELIGSAATDPPTGLFALDKVPLFNILCLPRIARVFGTATNFQAGQVATVVGAATNYVESRRAFLILDTPSDLDTLLKFKAWLSALDPLRHRNLALYFPRLQLADPLNDFRPRSFGASGTIAGLYARTDAARGVWKAPAGTEAALRGVAGLDYRLSDQENGVVNPLGINAIRKFDVYGIVSWGARTLVGADQQTSEWKYVPVRRLALFLEESLYEGTKWVVFEPNDEPLWAQIRLNVGAFMHNLFRQGAFQGKTPREAYLVKCDAETTTQADIDLGVVNIVVGFAPLKPAEFVIIRIQQLAGQIET